MKKQTTTSKSNRPTTASRIVNQSRRRYLRACLGSGVIALSGCSSDSEPDESRNPIVDISFEQEEMIVTIAEDFDVNEVHLIGPDGALQSKAAIQESTQRGRLQLLDVKSLDKSTQHYTKGQHELVVDPDDDAISKVIDLKPELSVQDVHPYASDNGEYAGRLAVDILNEGSGPTWISGVLYENSPNVLANNETLSNNYPYFHSPERPIEAILLPGESKKFVGQPAPLRVSSQNSTCSGISHKFRVKIASPGVSEMSRTIQAERQGDVRYLGFSEEHVCTRTSTSLLNPEE